MENNIFNSFFTENYKKKFTEKLLNTFFSIFIENNII